MHTVATVLFNISLHHDTKEAIYQYMQVMYCPISSGRMVQVLCMKIYAAMESFIASYLVVAWCKWCMHKLSSHYKMENPHIR